jgi:hypothetical protein
MTGWTWAVGVVDGWRAGGDGWNVTTKPKQQRGSRVGWCASGRERTQRVRVLRSAVRVIYYGGGEMARLSRCFEECWRAVAVGEGRGGRETRGRAKAGSCKGRHGGEVRLPMGISRVGPHAGCGQWRRCSTGSAKTAEPACCPCGSAASATTRPDHSRSAHHQRHPSLGLWLATGGRQQTARRGSSHARRTAKAACERSAKLLCTCAAPVATSCLPMELPAHPGGP